MAEIGSGRRRAALVIGASYGIGAAVGPGLARDGFDVAVPDVRIAEERAGAVRYPASYITGQVLLLDGGLTAYRAASTLSR